jgi:hypothetical protein
MMVEDPSPLVEVGKPAGVHDSIQAPVEDNVAEKRLSHPLHIAQH